jgi:aspartyl-tRNA(Asn)/glutamyl-tRNA(Gln) amidotransferase subunit C
MDTATVKRMAELSRIAMSEQEMSFYQEALAKLLKLEENVLAIPTEGVQPMSQIHEEATPLRLDVVTESDERDLFQSVAPATMAGLYLVPKVIE